VSEQEQANASGGGKKQDRSWLTTYLLMMLRSWNAYGYELVRQLTVFGFGAIDPANVYRALRDLERDGYVTSQWDTNVTSGPARRVYTITEAGLEALNLWSSALDNYRQTLDRFFQLYQGGTPMPQAAPPTPEPQRAQQAQATDEQPDRGTTDAETDSARR
jgi:PadR family transcriptional regulator PadR